MGGVGIGGCGLRDLGGFKVRRLGKLEGSLCEIIRLKGSGFEGDWVKFRLGEDELISRAFSSVKNELLGVSTLCLPR